MRDQIIALQLKDCLFRIVLTSQAIQEDSDRLTIQLSQGRRALEVVVRLLLSSANPAGVTTMPASASVSSVKQNSQSTSNLRKQHRQKNSSKLSKRKLK